MELCPSVGPYLDVKTARQLLLSGILICPRLRRICLVLVCCLQSYYLFLLCTPGCHNNSDHSSAKIGPIKAASRATGRLRSISFSSASFGSYSLFASIYDAIYFFDRSLCRWRKSVCRRPVVRSALKSGHAVQREMSAMGNSGHSYSIT